MRMISLACKRLATLCALVVSVTLIAGGASAANISSIPGDSAAPASFTLNNVEVVGILDSNATFSNSTIVLQDATGSIIDFRLPFATYTPQLGDIVNVTATDSPFQDGPELVAGGGTTGFAPQSVTLVSSGNPVNIPVITIPQFNAASGTTGSLTQYGESIVTLDNVHFVAGAPATLAQNTAYTITDGTNSAVLYAYKSDSNVGATPSTTNGLAQLNALGGGTATALNITGYVSNFFGASEFYPLSATAAPEPSSFALAGMGLLTLLAVRRARSRS